MSGTVTVRSRAADVTLGARRLLRGPIGVTSILVLLALSGLLGAGQALPVATHAPIHAGPAAIGPLTPTAASSWSSRAPATTAPLAPLGPVSPPSYGRGTFFTTTSLPQIPFANQSCIVGYYGPTCGSANVTNNPSLNLTTNGVMAMAYTAFTNATPCGNLASAEVEVAVSVSSDLGSTWSTPTFLGNTQCNAANETNFTDAWQPTITSLGNGTIVVAYIEFNVSNPYAYSYNFVPNLYFGPYSYDVLASRLVVQESYDNGATWSHPTVLNTSYDPNLTKAWEPARPWITAIGNTLYVTWYNSTEGFQTNYATSRASGSSQVHLEVSTNGGASWGGRIDLPVVSTNNSTDFWAIDPTDLVLPNGELVISYVTNLSVCYPCIINGTYYYGAYFANLVAALSSNNGTSFTLSTIVADSTTYLYAWGPADSYAQARLAYSPATHQLFVASTMSEFQTVCQYGYCYLSDQQAILVANATVSGGAVSGSWSSHYVPSLLAAEGAGYGAQYNPAIAVGPNGMLELEATITNGSLCSPITPSICAAQDQVYTTSSDNGSSWTGAVSIGPWSFEPYSYDGEYSSLLAVGRHVYVGWTMENCPGYYRTGTPYPWCDFPPMPNTNAYYTNNGSSLVQFSSLFEGVGLNISFSETGLIAGTHWTVDFGGNQRAQVAPGSLSVSGVPPNTLNVSWTVNATSTAYGIRYFPTGSIGSPSNFSKNTTVNEHFDRQYLVNIESDPYIPPPVNLYGCYGMTVWDDPYCPMVNYNITPAPGQNWVNAGASINVGVTPSGNYCTQSYGCYYYYTINLTFESWTGAGNGSSNTSANATTVVANGPVNETANFFYNGWCEVGYRTAAVCVASNASVTFLESGLPSGTEWGVSTWGPGGRATTPVSSFTNTGVLPVSSPATAGVTYFSAWVVPGATSGTYWVPTTDPVSPVELPTEPIVNVNYTLSSSPPAGMRTVVQALGLPTTTTPWSFGLDANLYGESTASTSFTLGTGSHTFNATPVYLTNGTGYYPSAIDVLPFLINGTWQNTSSVPATVTLHDDAYVVVQYSPSFRVQATASTGGSVSSDVTWVKSGQSVTLNATAMVGYQFVDWTGFGSGAINASTASIRVAPVGPVNELATFQKLPPPRFEVNVTSTGLFAGDAFTVTLGGVSYTGYGTIHIPGLLAGNYSFADQTVYANASSLTEFTPTGMTTTFTTNGAGALEVGSDGTVALTYTPSFALLVSSTGPGSTTPSGFAWETNGTTATVTATPAAHYMLLGWNGSGPGSYTGTDLSFPITLSAGPVSEAAQFVYRPNPPPAVYHLQVTETGLPTGTTWGYSIGGTSASGASATTLTVNGLNGTYTMAVGIVAGTTAGVRYVPTAMAPSVPVTANATYNVTYVTQYLLTVVSGTGGTVSGAGGWYNASTVVSLTATAANASYAFTSWNASGGASATTPTISVTMSGPVTETAVFQAVYPAPHSTGSSTAGLPLALGLLGVLLLAGLLAGLVAGRRRRPPAETTEPMEQWQPDSTGSEAASEGTENPPPAEGN